MLQFHIHKTEELPKVTAEKGDGIYKILRENNYDPKEFFDAFIEINRNKILPENQLIEGEVYYLPGIFMNQITNNNLIDSLLRVNFKIDTLHDVNKDIADTSKQLIKKDTVIEIDYSDNSILYSTKVLMYADTVIDNQLEGALIFIISGHGGPDPGAVAMVEGVKISEDEYAYDICLRIAQKIEEHGGKPIMIIIDTTNSIRDDRILPMDKTELCYPNLTIPLNHIERLQQRVDAVNEVHKQFSTYRYQRVIEVHLDSRGSGTGVDVFFYHHPTSVKGRELAENIRNTFDAKYAKHQPNRGYSGTVSARNLFVIRKTNPPAILIELGNIQNPRDQKRFLNYKNRQALANWITEGIIKDFNKN